MKINAPEKIYLLKSQNRMLDGWYNELPSPKTFEQVEYIRADAFIDKAKEFIWTHTEGSDYHVNYVLKEFEKYMKGE